MLDYITSILSESTTSWFSYIVSLVVLVAITGAIMFAVAKIIIWAVRMQRSRRSQLRNECRRLARQIQSLEKSATTADERNELFRYASNCDSVYGQLDQPHGRPDTRLLATTTTAVLRFDATRANRRASTLWDGVVMHGLADAPDFQSAKIEIERASKAHFLANYEDSARHARLAIEELEAKRESVSRLSDSTLKRIIGTR